MLNKKDFVELAGVNFASEEAQVVFDDSQTSAADIAKIIEKTGYGAKEKTEDALSQPEETGACKLAAVAAVRHQRPVPYRHGRD